MPFADNADEDLAGRTILREKSTHDLWVWNAPGVGKLGAQQVLQETAL